MSEHHERECTINEPDTPNIMAVYIIIIISLVSLVVVMYGLAEYKAHIDKKRNSAIEAEAFEVKEQIEKQNAPLLKIIDKKLEEAKKADFPGL